MHNLDIELAVKYINAGHIIAYPTESVYGLGCNPKNLDAIQKILEIKQRSSKKGLILVASNIEQIIPYLDNPSSQIINKIEIPSEQAITWLVPANKNVSSLITGEHKTIAIRLSKHPVIVNLCEKLGYPIISTSANKAGEDMLWSAAEVKSQFSSELAYILDAPLGGATKPSEIRDIMSGQVFR